MGRVLEFIGWGLIIASLAIALYAGGNSALTPFLVALYLFPVIFAGMLIVAFGSMVTELTAIRTVNERMERHLSTIADRLKGPSSSQATTSDASRSDWQRPY